MIYEPIERRDFLGVTCNLAVTIITMKDTIPVRLFKFIGYDPMKDEIYETKDNSDSEISYTKLIVDSEEYKRAVELMIEKGYGKPHVC